MREVWCKHQVAISRLPFSHYKLCFSCEDNGLWQIVIFASIVSKPQDQSEICEAEYYSYSDYSENFNLLNEPNKQAIEYGDQQCLLVVWPSPFVSRNQRFEGLQFLQHFPKWIAPTGNMTCLHH